MAKEEARPADTGASKALKGPESHAATFKRRRFLSWYARVRMDEMTLGEEDCQFPSA